MVLSWAFWSLLGLGGMSCGGDCSGRITFFCPVFLFSKSSGRCGFVRFRFCFPWYRICSVAAARGVQRFLLGTPPAPLGFGDSFLREAVLFLAVGLALAVAVATDDVALGSPPPFFLRRQRIVRLLLAVVVVVVEVPPSPVPRGVHFETLYGRQGDVFLHAVSRPLHQYFIFVFVFGVAVAAVVVAFVDPAASEKTC